MFLGQCGYGTYLVADELKNVSRKALNHFNTPCVRQPFCDESGDGFGVAEAEKPTVLWSHYLILRSDETWLPEWSGKLGGVERCGVRPRGWSWGKPVCRPSE